jgi:HEAT repeats
VRERKLANEMRDVEGLSASASIANLLEQIESEQRSAPHRVGKALLQARESRHPVIREAVLESLPTEAASTRDWIEFVHTALLGRNSSVRCAAAAAIARLGWASFTEDLTALLQDRDHLVRVAAVEALWALKAGSKCSDLRAVLSSDRHWLVRGYAVAAYAELCNHAETSVLEERLVHERSGWVSAQLLIALCASGKTEYLTPLLRKLQSKDYRVRYTVAKNLDAVAPDDNTDLIRASVRAALANETTAAVKEVLQQAEELLASRTAEGLQEAVERRTQ